MKECDHEWRYPNDLYFDLVGAAGYMTGKITAVSDPIRTHTCNKCGARLLQKLKLVEYDILPEDVFDDD